MSLEASLASEFDFLQYAADSSDVKMEPDSFDDIIDEVEFLQLLALACCDEIFNIYCVGYRQLVEQ